MGSKPQSSWRRCAQLAVIAMLASATGLAQPAGAETVVADDTPLAGWRVNGPAYAVKVVDNIVYVGGSFTEARSPDGTTSRRVNLAAFDVTSGSLIGSFRADTDGRVRALASDGSTLWVGGSFGTIGGVSRSRLAAVDGASGSVRTGFKANANSNVYALDYRAGRLFVGGSFSAISGVSRSRAAEVDPGSGAARPWNPVADATVHAVRATSTADNVYLGGNFATVGGAARTGVAVVNGTNGAVLSRTFNSQKYALALDLNEDGTRLFGGFGGSSNELAAWDTATGAKKWHQVADGDVQAVAVQGDVVYFGFHDGFAGDLTLRLLAADATTGAIDSDFRPTFDSYWGVRSLSVTDGYVVAGGEFTKVSGVPAEGLVRFPIAGGAPPPSIQTVQFTGPSTTWRYLDKGVYPGAGWTTTGFDDSTFKSGLPQLGYGDGDETTVVSYGPDSENKYITTYFRTTFSVDTVPTSLTVSLVADDGAVVYVNGVEVVRDNMPAGTIENSTLAASTRDSGENDFRTFTVDPSVLVAGANTVATEVHQVYRKSSDISFDLRVSGQVPA